MNLRRMTTILLAAVLAATTLAAIGCGEKITIPEPVGKWSLAPYSFDAEFEDTEGPVQLTQSDGSLFVITPNAVTKRNQDYEERARFGGLIEATAMCVDPVSGLVFVWQQGSKSIGWHRTDDLWPVGFTSLPEIGSVTAMAANASGIAAVPGADTFIYLSDPESGVIHRYAFDSVNGLTPYGILANSDGEGARFVHHPAGMATDHEDSLLVCDADTNRNWVIRFVSVPDTSDLAPVPGDPNPLRGWATEFDDSTTCPTPAPSDFVLGNAAECNEPDWVGGTSDAEGEFHTPTAVAVDARGRIFVADTGNDRIQVFDPLGYFDLYFGTTERIPGPTAIALVEKRTGTREDEIFPAGFVYVLVPVANKVVRFIDRDYFNARSESQPPPPPP